MKIRRRPLIALSLLGIFIAAFVITDIAGASPRFGFIQTMGEFLGVSSIPTSAALRNETTEKVSQGSSSDDPSGDFWQEIPKTQNDNLGRAIEIEASEYRAFTLNKDAMRTKLLEAPQEFTADARRGTFIL